MESRKLVGLLALSGEALVQSDAGIGRLALDERPGDGKIGILERAILNHLGVDATVTGAADLLEEGAIQQRADLRARLAYVDCEAGRKPRSRRKWKRWKRREPSPQCRGKSLFSWVDQIPS